MQFATLLGRRRRLAGGLLGAATALLALAGPAAADESDGTAQKAPTEAGTSFRTAAQTQQDQKATASASTGDYLYWSFPADAGQRPTVKATVELPEPQARHGAQTWRIDVYDGLRRRQPCQYGMQARAVEAGANRVELACTLRTVRALADAWSNDPLPGTYYVRLTTASLADADLGLLGDGVDGGPLEGHRRRGGGRRQPVHPAGPRHDRLRRAGRTGGRLGLGLVDEPLAVDGGGRGARGAGGHRRLRADPRRRPPGGGLTGLGSDARREGGALGAVGVDLWRAASGAWAPDAGTVTPCAVAASRSRRDGA